MSSEVQQLRRFKIDTRYDSIDDRDYAVTLLDANGGYVRHEDAVAAIEAVHAQWAAEVERLTRAAQASAMNTNFNAEIVIRYEAERDSAQAEAKALKADAERYRWLRAGVSGQRDTGGVAYFQTRVVAPVLDNIMRGSVAEHYDNAIDNAATLTNPRAGETA